MPPRGMHRQSIELSESQIAKHHLEYATVMIGGNQGNKRGDGWVLNEAANGHLSGSTALWNEDDKRHHLVPIDNVLPQYWRIKKSNQTEIDRVFGAEDENGVYIPGELAQILWTRQRLPLWLTLDESHRDEIANVYGPMADIRSRAYNVFNRRIGDRAESMRRLEDKLGRKNPSKIMAQTHPLESDERGRAGQLGRVRAKNELRDYRLTTWISNEDQILGQTHAVLDRLINDQDDDDLDSLKSLVRHVHFRIPIFNQLAYNLSQTGGRIEDPAVVRMTMEGIHFHRGVNFLLNPFRRLAVHPDRVTDPSALEQDELELEERLSTLEELEMTGAYGTLSNRVIILGKEALQAAQNHDPDLAKAKSMMVKWLLTRLCLPEDDPEKDKWYGHQLVTQS
jgi:hypothetical protein